MHRRVICRDPQGPIAGVCEGIGRHFGVQPNVVRALWLFSVLFMGTGVMFYLALWWLMPTSDKAWQTHTPKKFLGVCAAISDRFEWDPTVVRLSALMLGMISAPWSIAAYIVAALFIDRPHPALRA